VTCPHLEYREGVGGAEAERAYCTVVDGFVEPMRADICNDRFDLSHAEHCEFYRESEGLTEANTDADSEEGV
jgi:hypothetical protein